MARPAAPLARSAPAQTPKRCVAAKAIEIDFSDPDTLIAIAGAVLGVGVGLGAPILYMTAAGENPWSPPGPDCSAHGSFHPLSLAPGAP